MNAIERAIEIKGGPSGLANALGLRWPSVITNWVARGKVPVERCSAIEAATDGKVTKSDLRPDIWPPDATAAPSQVAAQNVRKRSRAA